MSVRSPIKTYTVSEETAATGFGKILIHRLSKNVMSAAKTKQRLAKKRSLQGVNEHFEPVFNEVFIGKRNHFSTAR